MNFHENRSSGTELIHVDGQTEGPTEEWIDITKLVVTFFQFCEHACKVNNSAETTHDHMNTMRLFC
jgi:hypothetical protein